LNKKSKTFEFYTSEIHHPPHPAPVNLEPYAPAFLDNYVN